jgi:hypothetical protein
MGRRENEHMFAGKRDVNQGVQQNIHELELPATWLDL